MQENWVWSLGVEDPLLPAIFFTDLEQIISRFIWKYKKISNSQSNLEKEEWNWRNRPASLQTILKSNSHQDSMVLAQSRNIHQWNKVESLETNPRTFGHLIFGKGGKNVQWRKDNLFNKWCWENWSTTFKRMKRSLSNTVHKNKLKMD